MRVRSAGCVAVAASLALLAGCGSADQTPRTAPTTKAASTDEGDGAWLLRFSTASGSDGEDSGTILVSVTPATGQASVRTLPTLLDPDTYADRTAVLISADHRYALNDARIPRAEGKRGRLRVYATTGTKDKVVDVRALTRQRNVVPLGAAFDPGATELLRVVDTKRRVWKLDLIAGTGTRDGSLPRHPGWIFANGFDKNSGFPYIEATDSEETLPPGNGADDVRPVRRQGGEIVDESGDDPPGPTLPCGFATGFRTADGTTWLFCADTARIKTYRLAKDADAWQPVGKPTAAILPSSASELPVVLPPVS